MKRSVIIDGNEFKVKSTLRSVFLFEEITGKPFKIEKTIDNYVYFYSILLANNPEATLTWDEFIDALDRNPGIILEMNTILAEAGKVEKLLEGEEDGEEKKK